MPPPRVHRRLGLIALPTLLAALSGCALTGNVVIDPDDMVHVDVVYWMSADDYGGPQLAQGRSGCDPFPQEKAASLQLAPASDPANPDALGCHITGELPLEQISRQLILAHVGDRYVFRTVGDALSNLTTAPGQNTFSITFPGAIESHDEHSSVDGNTVTWDGLGTADVGELHVIAVVERERPEIPLALLGGLAVGVTGAVLVRRRRFGRTVGVGTKVGAEPPATKDRAL